MARFGFVGGSYQSQSPYADLESTMNWFPEIMESQGAKSAMCLYPTPGLSLFGTSNGNPIGLLLSMNGRLFGLETQSGASTFYEFSSTGSILRSFAVTGPFINIVAGNFYVFFAGPGGAWAFSLANNTLTNVTSKLTQSTPSCAFFIDGYYGVLYQNSNEFQISALEDPTTWNGVDVAQVSVFPENLVGCLVDHRVLWLWGSQHGQAYYDSGDPNFPLNVIPGAFIEQGLSAPRSPVRMDNSVFWIGADERGSGVAWRANGYTPVRVSNHAIEYQWSQYPQGASDAIGWTYQDGGHTFWVLYFPSGNATWVYDAATNMWHQRGHWNGTSQDAHLAQAHAYCFGKHIVADRSSRNLYVMSSSNMDDNGTEIVRTRTAPVIATEQEWLFHRQLTIDMDVNLSPNPDPNPNPEALYISWSDDAGKTWTAPQSIPTGDVNNTVQRVVIRRLGRSRQRVYSVTVYDKIPWRIIDAYVIADPGFAAVPRFSKYWGQME